MRHRPAPAPVGPVEGFGAVAGDVDARRAVPRAGFARQAQVEGLQDPRRRPVEQAAVGHLLQDADAPPGRVLLVARGLVGGAHEHPDVEAGGAAVAHARAAVDGPGHVAVVVGEVEASRVLDPAGVRAAHVRVEGIGAHEDSRIEDACGVEQAFDPAEQAEDLRAVHAAEQFGAGPAVAVLAGERAAEAGGEVRRLLHEGPEPRPPVVRFEGEVDADVQAAVAEVPVEEACQAVRSEKRLEFADVGAEVLRRNGRILPSRPGGVARRGAAAQARAVGADAPQLPRFGPGGADVHGVSGRCVGQGSRPRHGVDVPLGPDFDEEPPGSGGQCGHGALGPPDRVDELGVQAFDGQRAVGQEGHGVVGGGGHVRISEDDEHRRGL